MAREITVPRLGWTMEEGTFGGWLKADGEAVSAGDERFLLESDKASEAITSLEAGILCIPPDGPQKGDTVAVGQRLGFLVAEGEEVRSDRTHAVAAPVRPEKSGHYEQAAAPRAGPDLSSHYERRRP